MQDEFSVFKFNPQTGNRLNYVGGSKFQDSVTGQSVYVNPKPTCCAIIEDKNGQVLLVQRKFDPGKDMWDLPGGFIEINETLEQGLHRELKEELDVSVAAQRYFGSAHTTYEYEGINFPILDFCFLVQLKDDLNKFGISDDVTDYKWVSYHTISYDEIHGETIKKFLKTYFSHR